MYIMKTDHENRMLSIAIEITAAAFSYDLDKGGRPYILHCIHVMNNIGKKTKNDPEMMQIAIMHDLIEDKPEWTFDRLQRTGFSDRVIAGIESMTHLPDEDYDQYINRIAVNEDAVMVKLIDLKHNMDPTRMKGLRGKDFARIEKYHHAFAYLATLTFA